MSIVAQVERFVAMGTRVELHVFGGEFADAVIAARRAIEGVDDALTIHRPSPTTAVNDALLAGRGVAIDDPVLIEALIAIQDVHALTDGLFDPAIDQRRLIDGLRSLRVPRQLFKFLYRLLVAHCHSHTDEQAVYTISPERFESELALFRRDQDAFDRGLAPR